MMTTKRFRTANVDAKPMFFVMRKPSLNNAL